MGSTCHTLSTACTAACSTESFLDEDLEDTQTAQDCYHPRESFVVKLTRSGPHWKDIGVCLCKEFDTYITIHDIWAPSLLSEWNKRQLMSTTKVRPGDGIIAVNQCRVADQMMVLLQRAEEGEDLALRINPGIGGPGISYASQPTRRPSGPSCGPDATAKRYSRCAELKPHLEVLDLPDSASDEAIRMGYKRLCRQWHPDKNLDNVEEAKEKFQAVNTAYNVIKEKLRL